MITQKQKQRLKTYYTAIQASYKWVDAKNPRSGRWGGNIGYRVQGTTYSMRRWASGSVEGSGGDCFCEGATGFLIRDLPQGLHISYYDKVGETLDHYYL